TAETGFEKAPASDVKIDEQEYFDHGVLLVAMIKAGVELAFETMVESGIVEESAYYESLHETPLIANTIARRKLYEMNVVISDTAKYGNNQISHAAIQIVGEKYMTPIRTCGIGKGLKVKSSSVDNKRLIEL